MQADGAPSSAGDTDMLSATSDDEVGDEDAIAQVSTDSDDAEEAAALNVDAEFIGEDLEEIEDEAWRWQRLDGKGDELPLDVRLAPCLSRALHRALPSA